MHVHDHQTGECNLLSCFSQALSSLEKALSGFGRCCRPSQLVPVKSFPERQPAKQNDWNRGPFGIFGLHSPPPKKPTPTKICQQNIGARQHDITAITSSLHPCMRHVALHQVNGPGIWIHLRATSRNAWCRAFGLEGGDPWLSRRTDQKSLAGDQRRQGDGEGEKF